MNKLYIDQIVRYMNSARLEFQNYYDDVAMANGALRWTVAYLEKLLGNCHGVTDGRCYFHWKHDDCARLMDILYDLTGDEKYTNKPIKGNSWD
jgi:hypothetical protein